MNQRGFTLIEMMIGMTLLGLMLILLYGGLRLGVRSWDAGEKVLANASQQVVVTDFVRRQLSLVYPLRWKNDTQETLAFSGDSHAVHFASQIPVNLGAGGIHLVALEQTEEGNSDALRMRWRLPTPESRDFGFNDENGEVFLVRNIENIEFAYFGAVSDAVDPSWHDSWQGEDRLPLLIRLRVTNQDGSAWPEIVTALKLEPEAACRWDSFTRRCM